MNEKPQCMGRSKGRDHLHPKSDSQMKKIRDFYRPFKEQFYSLVGYNFGWP